MAFDVSRSGQLNWDNSDDRALFMEIMINEVIAAFDTKRVAKGMFVEKTIDKGKSATFPMIWQAESYYHTPGDQVTGKKIKHSEKVITIDDLLISPVFISIIDEAMNHYDVRVPYSTAMGRALANAWDKNVLQCAVLAARTGPIFTDTGGDDPVQISKGGTVIYTSDFGSATKATKAEALADGIYEAAQILDEKDVPDEGRVCTLRPAEYYSLVNDDKVLNRDYGGKGSYAEGRVVTIAGIKIQKSNHVPSTNIVSGKTKYQGDFTGTVGIVSVPQAVGTVKLLDLQMEADYLIDYQGHLMVAKYLVGHDTLRPDAAIELNSSADTGAVESY
jgi:hypothetical protein